MKVHNFQNHSADHFQGFIGGDIIENMTIFISLTIQTVYIYGIKTFKNFSGIHTTNNAMLKKHYIKLKLVTPDWRVH